MADVIRRVAVLNESGTATSTGRKVHRALRDEGLVYTAPGMGSFVAKR